MQTRLLHHLVLFSLSLSLLGSAPVASAQSGLQVTYGDKGIQTLSFNGAKLADTIAFPADSFHIWHMKSGDLRGRTQTSGQYGWGESNNGAAWNAATKTETYAFSWGSIATQFKQNGNNLDIVVTERNNAGSGIVFDGAEIFPVTLHFPNDPVAFSGYSQYVITTTGPGVSVADYGSGMVTSVIPDESIPLYGGWKNLGLNTYSPIISGTAPDGLATFLPHHDAPVQPGGTLSYTVSLRFTSKGTAAQASDAYASFAAKYPSQLTWSDRRILGTAYLASSPQGPDHGQPGGFPTNPRRYFNDPSVDITSQQGMQAFQTRMLAQAATNVATTRNLGGQGVITWDLEGEQYPQSTSYVCSPDQVATVAPEMERPILDRSSPYFGQKLDDAYFKIMSNAGLKIGLCLRPQAFTLAGDGTASQVFLPSNAAIIANLENKAKYATSRWGATIFYVDSTVNPDGGTLDPAIFQQLITDFPGFLFIPEESTPRYYAYSAPFYSFLFHGDLGTPAAIRSIYPQAFGANLVNDVAPNTLAAHQSELTASVVGGDILMGHADYWQANNATLVSMYQAAGKSAAPPTRTLPHLSWTRPTGILYGTALSSQQLNASADLDGTFTYLPPPGTILPAGNQTLLAMFTPADPQNYTEAVSSTTLLVGQAVPALLWPQPAAIVLGTSLLPAQLNATANVPGRFIYTPQPGTVPAVGVDKLHVIFIPADTRNYTEASALVALTVAAVQQSTPILAWSPPSPITYGQALTPSQLNAAANVPGTFTYTPPAGTILAAGPRVLVTAFTPADPVLYRPVVTSIALQVLSAPVAAAALAILAPADGTMLSGHFDVQGQVNLNLDSAGSYLIVDGEELGTHRVTGGPFIYSVDTTALANGSHSLQLWAHDVGNKTTVSRAVLIQVRN